MVEKITNLENQDRYSAKSVTSPHDICNNEWLRSELHDQFEWTNPVPTDVFIMANGEPDDRFVTKVGGLPYRRADHPWPVNKNGNPLTFIAQFNFLNSKDIVGELPGDLLLIFGDNLGGGFFEDHHFEWAKINISKEELVSEIPEVEEVFAPCYGFIYRTVNYPYTFSKSDEVTFNGRKISDDFQLPELQATQISTSAFYPQGDEDIQLLCTINTVEPTPYANYPWINQEKPLSSEYLWSNPEPHLQIGDSGCIYIGFDKNGDLVAFDQCY